MSQVLALKSEWLGHRNVLPDLLDRLADDQITFMPWEGAMTLGALTVHIVTSTNFFLQAIKSGTFERPTPLEYATLADVKRIVQEYTAQSQALYDSLSDADLEEVLEAPFMGIKAPKAAFLGMLRDHEVHHKGQLFVYTRMAGVKEMPFFVKRG